MPKKLKIKTENDMTFREGFEEFIEDMLLGRKEYNSSELYKLE